MYCIYTDKDVSPKEGNLDHIIPLSLGGRDQFVVWSERKMNSELGSKVDARLGQDLMLSFALRNSGVKGHGGKILEPRWRRVTLEGRPFQVTWGKDQVRFWDSRARKEIDHMDAAGKELQTQLSVDAYAATRFLAKTALGGGYFLYGDDFRAFAACAALRKLMQLNVDRDREDRTLKESGIKICDWYHPDSRHGEGATYRTFCEATKRSIFISIPHEGAISFHIGIVGVYVGSIIVPGNTTKLPREGEHDLGHAIILAPGEMQRVSFRALALDLARSLNMPIPDPDGNGAAMRDPRADRLAKSQVPHHLGLWTLFGLSLIGMMLVKRHIRNRRNASLGVFSSTNSVD